ncbi:hypothetical protein [Acholeplasma granularum]|uniref:hypothetical protein n=1 Tax=Acholeplasma granularum TaxID=264635 RepID=UPI00138AF555|nr:hypothetical protein [Acholeplasma granularum]
MQCKKCLKRIKLNINLNNIFETYRNEICNSCFKKNMNYYPYFVIPIKYGLLHIFELLYEKDNLLDSYMDYFRPYYLAYLKSKPSIDAIYIEILDQKTIELFDQLNLGHLIIFTNNYKEEQ